MESTLFTGIGFEFANDEFITWFGETLLLCNKLVFGGEDEAIEPVLKIETDLVDILLLEDWLLMDVLEARNFKFPIGDVLW